MIMHHGCVGTVGSDGAEGFTQAVFLFQTVTAHHFIHIYLADRDMVCHFFFQLDGKADHGNTILDVGVFHAGKLGFILDAF